MIERRHRFVSHGPRAVILCVLLPAIAFSTAGAASFDEAYRYYKKAETKLDAGAYDDALTQINRALEANEASGVFRVGIQQRSYYPHFLRGLIHLRLGDAAAARGDFATELDKGEIQNDAGLHGRLMTALTEAESVDTEPPIVRVENVEIADFLTFEGNGTERVRVRLQGFALDSQSGIRSLSVGGQELALTSSEDSQRFDELITVDATETSVRIVAVDSAGNEARVEHGLNIPPLDLGNAAAGIHAVVVGVNEYDKSYRTDLGDCRSEVRSACGTDEEFACYSIPDLSYAAVDAQNFSDLLLRRGVPRENVRLLTSRDGNLQATRANVLAALDEIEKAEGERVIFYFSGHGISSRREQNLMLLSDTRGWECGVPSRETTAVEESALGVTEVARALARSPIKQRYIILDACRSPSLATKGTDGPQASPGFSAEGIKGLGLVTVTEREDPGWDPIVFYSTLDRKVSVEWSRMSSGYFTYYLLQGLRRDLPLGDLKVYVQSNVKRQTIEDLCSADLPQESCPFAQAPYLQLPEILENDYELQAQTFLLGTGTP